MAKKRRFSVAFVIREWIEVPAPAGCKSYEEALAWARKLEPRNILVEVNKMSSIVDNSLDICQVWDQEALDKLQD